MSMAGTRSPSGSWWGSASPSHTGSSPGSWSALRFGSGSKCTCTARCPSSRAVTGRSAAACPRSRWTSPWSRSAPPQWEWKWGPGRARGSWWSPPARFGSGIYITGSLHWQVAEELLLGQFRVVVEQQGVLVQRHLGWNLHSQLSLQELRAVHLVEGQLCPVVTVNQILEVFQILGQIVSEIT